MNNLTYFSKGFSLTNRSPEIYLIFIGLSLFGILDILFKGSPIVIALQIVSFIGFFFSFGFQMSVPLFFTFKQQAKPLDFNNMWPVILRNTKRMILPIILMVILFMILLFALLIWFIVSHPGNSQDIATAAIKNFPEQMMNWNPLFIIFGIPLTLFSFTPIYFSVENKGFFASMRRSVSFSLRHLNFIVLLILFGAAISTVTTFIRIPFENRLGWLILGIITQYVGLILSASTLLFYQSKHNS